MSVQQRRPYSRHFIISSSFFGLGRCSPCFKGSAVTGRPGKFIAVRVKWSKRGALFGLLHWGEGGPPTASSHRGLVGWLVDEMNDANNKEGAKSQYRMIRTTPPTPPVALRRRVQFLWREGTDDDDDDRCLCSVCTKTGNGRTEDPIFRRLTLESSERGEREDYFY